MTWLFSLQSIFPELLWVKSADAWLASIHQKSIAQQLEERRIKKVRVWCINTVSGYITIEDFGILLVIDRDLVDHFLMGYKKIEELLFVFGHEIAHTFHLDFTKTPPLNIGPEKVFRRAFEKLPTEGQEQCDEVERFCDEFAARWSSTNGLTQFRDFFEKNKNTDLLSVKHDV